MAIRITTSDRNPAATQRVFPPSPFRLFEGIFNDWTLRRFEADQDSKSWVPPVDVLERDGSLILTVEAPGIREKDIELKLEGSILTIKGEKKSSELKDGATSHQSEIDFGTFSRTFTLPDTVDTGKISASFKNGLLTITLPAKPEAKPRTIRINAQ